MLLIQRMCFFSFDCFVKIIVINTCKLNSIFVLLNYLLHMNLHAHFILVNSDFNQSIADDFNEGQESEDNIKHLWEDELVVSEPIKEFKIKHNESYFLQGFYADNQAFNFEIQDVSIVDIISVTGTKTQFAVSKKLIKKTDKVVDEEKGKTHIYFYLSDAFPLNNPISGVYIIKKDFPKELIPVKNKTNG